MDMKKKLLLSMILLALCQMVTASLLDLNQSDSVENIAGEVAKVAKTDRSTTIMTSFGMTNNFISRFSKKYKA